MQLQDRLRDALRLNSQIVRQMNDASSSFVAEKRCLEKHLQSLRCPPLLAEGQPPLALGLVFADAATQTDSNWLEALVEEVHHCNARRFRAEALLRAAGLGRIPTNHPWELGMQHNAL